MFATPYLIRTILGICFGLLFSSNVLNMGLSQPQIFIQAFINQSIAINYNRSLTVAELKLAFGVLSATHYIFAPLGILLTRYVCDRFGRRITVFGLEGFFTILSVGAILSATATNRCELLYIGRGLFGLSYGVYMVALPTYIAEIVPPPIRGRVSAFFMVFEQITVIILFVVGLPDLMATEHLWPFINLLAAPACIVQFVCFFFAPESPKWLFLNRNKTAEAMEVVQKIHGNEVVISEMQDAYEREGQQYIRGLRLRTILKDPALRTSLLLATALAMSRTTNGAQMLQQFAFIMFTEDLHLAASTANYIMAGLILLMTLCGLVGMAVIDKVGRRPLVLFGLFGNALLAIAYVISSTYFDRGHRSLLYVALGSVVCLMCNYMFSLVMVSLFTVGELTAQAARPATASFSAFVNMLLRIFYFFVFPILQVGVGVYTVIILISVPSIVIGIYLAVELPETKQRPVEEVVDEIIRRKSSVMPLSNSRVKMAH